MVYRLYPTGPQITAKLHKDVALSGYFVPKGVSPHLMYITHDNTTALLLLLYFSLFPKTIVTIPMYLLGRDPDNFPEKTLEYFPERWDRTGGSGLQPAFAHVPFGFGPRMCVGNEREYRSIGYMIMWYMFSTQPYLALILANVFLQYFFNIGELVLHLDN